MPKLSRVRQLAAKIEASEGTAEALTAAEAKFLVYDPKIKFDVGMFQRNPARSSLSQMTRIPGLKKANLTTRLEIRGSGTAATAPAWFTLLRACGFKQSTVKTINIGAITSGPFVHGETITGTAAGTGRVVYETINGASSIKYVVLTGVIGTGETITGGTSAATATTSGSATDHGVELKPSYDVTIVPSLTMAVYNDGISQKLRGCRGKSKLTFKNGEPAFIDFEFMGAAITTPVTDTSLLSITHETTVPPVFLSAAATLATYAPVFSEIELDLAQTIAFRESANDASGILSTVITDREPTAKLNPEVDSVANYPIFAEWFAATERKLDFTLGSTGGNRFRFYAPKLQILDVDDADRDSLAIHQVNAQMSEYVTGTEDELTIVHY
jgi:hypothetical protein